MKLLLLIICLIPLAGCMTVNVTHYGPGGIVVQVDKAVSTSTLPIQADGNTVPVSAIP
jgi:hypothetical protein